MKTWAIPYSCKLMEAGIISYEDSGAGICYLTKQTIDRIAPSLIGKPVVIRHQKVTPENQEKLAVGYVTGVYFNPQDAWHYVNFLLTNDKLEAIEREDGSVVFKAPDGEILDGVSGAYDVTNTSEGGVWHDIKFDAEILDGSFTHLAIVTNPRYEETNKITEQRNMVLMNGKVAYQMKNSIEKELEEFNRNIGSLKSVPDGVKEKMRSEIRKGKTAAEAWDMHKDTFNPNSKENATDHDAMFAKEKKEHPEFTDEQIEQIVQDHIKEKQNALSNYSYATILGIIAQRSAEEVEAAIQKGLEKKELSDQEANQLRAKLAKKNSKEDPVNKIFKIFRRIVNGKDEKEEEVPDLVINVGGKEVSVKEAVNAYVANEKDEADEAEKKKKEAEAAENAKSLKMAKDDDKVIINGKSVSIADLKNAVEKRNKKNASESDEDKAKREKDEKEKAENEKRNAEEKEAKEKKEAEEKENAKRTALMQEKLNSKKAVGEIFIANNSKLEVGAVIEHEAKHYNVTEPDTQDGKPGYWAKENAKKGEEFFMRIQNAGNNALQEQDTTGPRTRSERAQAGRERYGSKNQK